MTTSADEVKRKEQSRQILRTLTDAVILIEPLQFKLWQSAGLTIAQIRLLRLLREGPQSPGQLAKQIGVLPASLTRMLDRLEEQGLVYRLIDPADRRRIEVLLKPEGRDLIGNHQIYRGSVFAEAAASMSSEEQEAFMLGVSALVRRVRELAASEASVADAADESVAHPKDRNGGNA